MKPSTLSKYKTILEDIKNSGLSVGDYCIANKLNNTTLNNTIKDIEQEPDSEIRNEIINLWEELTTTEVIDNDERSNISYERDANNKIKYYKYEIFRKNKQPIVGKFSRDEMTTIYRLYSYYGDSLTRRIVSRHFPELSLVDFNRILRAFSITKASAPFPPHYFEEHTEEELREFQIREKENSFLRKAEEDQIKNNEKLLKKYAKENIDLKKQIDTLSGIEVKLPEITPFEIPINDESGQDINLYLADMHLGSMCLKDSLYPENINYGFDEARRRLSEMLIQLNRIGPFDTLNLVLMGDNIDCCGIFGKTASLTHDMPENMQPREQANAYIELMIWFVESLIQNKLANQIRLFSVPSGNHSGNFEYLCNKTIMAMVSARWPEIQTTLWEKFYGVFEQNGHTFVCCHGKHHFGMKKGLPLNLDAKTQVLLYEWLDANKIYGTNIHIIKGDLHSNNMNSCYKFTYRNVLSLYGASDYSSYNFSRNAYGVSYDLLVNDNLISGTFENL